MSETFQIPDWPVPDPTVQDVLRAMMTNGSWGRYHGPHCDALRSALQEFHSTEHVFLCSSGTCAVELALRAVAIEPGDEVIMSAYDFKANFVNVLLPGAVPVLVDTLPGTPVIDAQQIPRACSSRTKAVLVSHLHGTMAPMETIMRIAAERGLLVIEDACQSPGAIQHAHRAGAMGDVGILSFGGSKLLTAGRGGAVLTNNATIAQRIRLYTQRGNESYPLSEMQAAVVLPQLLQLEKRNILRLQKVKTFLSALADHSLFAEKRTILSAGFEAASLPVSEHSNASAFPVFYKLALRFASESLNSKREFFCQSARSFGIPIDPGFSGLHLIHSRKRFRQAQELPEATRLHHGLMGLHHTALLLTDGQLIAMARQLTELALQLDLPSNELPLSLPET